MAQAVIRAAQTSYETSFTGGTKVDYADGGFDVGAFVDSIEVEDTPYLNSLKKGSAGSDRKEYSGRHAIMPRGSRVAAATTAAATSLPIIAGHGTRFQQGHVLRVTKAATGEYEILWVNADPGTGALSVKRAQGGTTALAFAPNDEVKVIGIAMPQLSDYPMAPVTRGVTWWNTYQKLSKHIVYSAEARKTRTAEFPNGDPMDRDMLALGKEAKRELNQALISGRRQEGDPDPSSPIPSMLGGLMFFAENSGNVFDMGGSGVNLTIEAIEDVLIELNEAYGSALGRRLIMSIHDKRIFNRLAHPVKYESGMGMQSQTKANLRWESVELDTGVYQFAWEKDIPQGVILIYQSTNEEYAAFEGLDWKEKEVPTKGDYFWKGMSGTFTYRPSNAQAYAMIKGYNTDLTDYPAWGKPAAA
jgi:hypothetical protein